MIATILIDSFTTNSGHHLHGRDQARVGLTVRSGNIFYAFNHDGVGSGEAASGTTNTATAYVVEWRHEGGNIYQRVNGVGETSTASGDTVGMTNTMFMGSVVTGSWSQPFDGKIFEMATFSTVPSLSDRNALVQSLGLWIGASV